MSIANVAAAAGVSRPAVYRRWPDKLALVSDALDYGLRAQLSSYPVGEDLLTEMTPRDALHEAIRRVDPAYANPDAVVLQGTFIAETNREPELMAILTERAVQPRVRLLEEVITGLIARNAVRGDIDVQTVATMCFGAFFAAHLRGIRDHEAVVDQVTATAWRLMTVQAPE